MSLRFAASNWYVLLVSLAIGCDPRSTPPPSQGTDKGAQAKEDKDAIQGQWTVVSGLSSSGSGEIVGESATFAGDKFTYSAGSPTLKFSATFTLDPAKNPKQIDFKNANGTLDPGLHGTDFGRRTVLGVYDLFGDELKLCVDESGKGRPLSSAATGNISKSNMGDRVMLILKRK